VSIHADTDDRTKYGDKIYKKLFTDYLPVMIYKGPDTKCAPYLKKLLVSFIKAFQTLKNVERIHIKKKMIINFKPSKMSLCFDACPKPMITGFYGTKSPKRYGHQLITAYHIGWVFVIHDYWIFTIKAGCDAYDREREDPNINPKDYYFKRRPIGYDFLHAYPQIGDIGWIPPSMHASAHTGIYLYTHLFLFLYRKRSAPYLF
jgi:hypothetical protein